MCPEAVWPDGCTPEPWKFLDWVHTWPLQLCDLNQVPLSLCALGLCPQHVADERTPFTGRFWGLNCEQLYSTYIALATCQQPLGAGLSREPPLHLSTVKKGPKTEILKAGDLLSEDTECNVRRHFWLSQLREWMLLASHEWRPGCSSTSYSAQDGPCIRDSSCPQCQEAQSAKNTVTVIVFDMTMPM